MICAHTPAHVDDTGRNRDGDGHWPPQARRVGACVWRLAQPVARSRSPREVMQVWSLCRRGPVTPADASSG
jgi:hypothetical protein